ncbi:MAG TPA: LOG family protein [Anaerolineaceae bacterium]|nr:LOG family protein [Anaerolineaceae bacterium]
MNITIFGGSSPLPDSKEYQFAYDLGKALASNGHTILTGGYMGTMEASSKGAAEAGGQVIGVTCMEIEKWRNRSHNAWVMEEWKSTTLQERMIKLIDSCDTAIALPGGPGTLAEIVLMWNRIQIESIPPVPIILVGEEWKKIFTTFFQELNGYIPPTSYAVIKFANTINEILTFLPDKTN